MVVDGNSKARVLSKGWEQRYRDRGFEMLTLKNNPDLDPLRPDPRFQDLLRRVGLQQ